MCKNNDRALLKKKVSIFKGQLCLKLLRACLTEIKEIAGSYRNKCINYRVVTRALFKLSLLEKALPEYKKRLKKEERRIHLKFLPPK